jgi:hypothetical protein
MKLIGFFAASALVASLTAGVAQAATLAFSPATLSAPDNYQAGLPVNLGMVFKANSNIDATALGFYDIPDLTGPEDLSLYNSSGDLLAFVVVDPTTAPLTSDYFFEPISPVALTKGQTYTVAAQVNDNPWQFGTLAPTSPQITFLNDSYVYGSSSAFPTLTGGSGPAYFGPNLTFAVPEPATWAMMLLGVGMIGAGLRLARRKNDKALTAA